MFIGTANVNFPDAHGRPPSVLVSHQCLHLMEHKNAKAKIDSPSSLLTDTTIRQLFETLVLLKRKGADMDVQVKVMVKKEADDQQGEHGAQDGDSWGEEEEAENLEEVELQPEGKGVGLGSEKTCGRQRKSGTVCDQILSCTLWTEE